MREVALAKLLLIDVVIDIDSFLPHIAPKFLYELARHAGPPQVGREPGGSCAEIIHQAAVYKPGKPA
jgi:hypothetical protein